MGFPTKNNHFGVFWGATILGNTHIENLRGFRSFQTNTPNWTELALIFVVFFSVFFLNGTTVVTVESRRGGAKNP